MIEVIAPTTIIVSSLIVLAIIHRMTGGISYDALLLGTGLLILTLIIQPPIQHTPILLLEIDLLHAPASVLAVALLYMAIVSGFLQELLKLMGVRGRTIEYALWLGAGFGLGEATLIALNQVISIIAGIGFPLGMGFISFYERLMVMLYHVFSSALLCHFYARNKGATIYVVMAATHSLMNYQATLLTSIYGLNTPVMVVVYSVITIVTAALSIAYWRRVSPWLKAGMYSMA